MLRHWDRNENFWRKIIHSRVLDKFGNQSSWGVIQTVAFGLSANIRGTHP